MTMTNHLTEQQIQQPLAIQGGPPAVEDPQQDADLFRWPIVTEEDERAVLGVLREGSMSGTGLTKQFEGEFARWIGRKYALGCCNGTASLVEAFWACGVGAGDEIICPSITYWASASPALTLGATVNFADIDPETLCLDPEDIEHRIGPRTKAIVPVHYAGHPAEMDRIMEIARKHDLWVIEDISHAHGGLYKGRMVGTFGHLAAMSMMSGKSFPIGEGGMLVTDDPGLYEAAIAFGHYGRTGGPSIYTQGEQGLEGGLAKFRGLPIGGVKHRMNQTCAAMGRVQLAHYDRRIGEIQRGMNRFWDMLEDVPGLHPHRPRGEDSTMGGWYHPLGLYRAEELGGLPSTQFQKAVVAEVGTAAGAGPNIPLHRHPVFLEADLFRQGQPTAVAFGQRDVRQGPGSLPVSERVRETAIGVPWFKHDQPDRIASYAAAYRKVALQAESLL